MEFTQLINKVISIIQTSEYMKFPNNFRDQYTSPVEYGLCLALQLYNIEHIQDQTMTAIVEEMMYRQISAKQYSEQSLMFYLQLIQSLNVLVQKHMISGYVMSKQEIQIQPASNYRTLVISEESAYYLSKRFGINFAAAVEILNDTSLNSLIKCNVFRKPENYKPHNTKTPERLDAICRHYLFGLNTQQCYDGTCQRHHTSLQQFINHPQINKWKQIKCHKVQCKSKYTCINLHDDNIDQRDVVINTMIYINYPEIFY